MLHCCVRWFVFIMCVLLTDSLMTGLVHILPTEVRPDCPNSTCVSLSHTDLLQMYMFLVPLWFCAYIQLLFSLGFFCFAYEFMCFY